MFEVFLKELAKRLNLGEKAPSLLGMVLSVMFDPARGGFQGFLDRFRAQGLGEALTSWLGNGENRALSAAQLESVLGPQAISQMARRLDLAPTLVATALGQIIPVTVDKLSPDGRLPQGGEIPAAVRTYLQDYSDFAATVVMPEVIASSAAQHTLMHGPVQAKVSGRRWAWLLIPVLIAAAAGIYQLQQVENAVPVSAPTEQVEPTPAEK